MHDYEVTFILNPNLGEDEVTANSERIKALIANAGGEVIDVHPWGGKRRLAYPIQHQREGFLIVRAFAGAAEHGGVNEFPVSQSSLADRLSITPPVYSR